MVVIADERTGKLDSGGNQQPVGWVSMFEMTELIGTGRRADFRRSGDTLTRAGVRCRCRATAWYVCRAGLHWSPLQFFACLGIEFVAEDDPTAVGTRAGEKAVRRLGPRKAKSARVPIVYDPRVSGGLLGHLASAINGAAIARGTGR